MHWHLDVTSIWVDQHGWVYLNAAIDRCTREVTGWAIDVRCRQIEATAVIDAAVAAASTRQLTLGTDNSTAYTSRPLRAWLAEQGITHRRGGYRDPESQAGIESWFSKPRSHCVLREEFETLQEAREKISAYIHGYTTGPTAASTTRRRTKSPRPGKLTPNP